jgi:aminoglycoside phosphotransferase (APT) family kinase protein
MTQLPEHVEISAEAVRSIARRHGIRAEEVARLPEVGITNAVYLLGDHFVLRVPRNHPVHIALARKEVVAAGVARVAGVRTPRIVAYDDAGDLLPVPYTVYERVHGDTLGLLELDPGDSPGTWRELGRDLGLLHTRVAEDGPAAGLGRPGLPDPRPRAEELAREGYFSATEERWLAGWLDRLAPAATAPLPARFLHGDVQATNVMVRGDTLDYLAVLDWGSCGWGDPARDFASGQPLRAVPHLLEGHREVAPLDGDDTAEARILWWQLQLALWLLCRRPQPGRSWGERPMAMLLDILRFAMESPGPRWKEWL